MKPLSIECPNLTCIINQSQPEWVSIHSKSYIPSAINTIFILWQLLGLHWLYLVFFGLNWPLLAFIGLCCPALAFIDLHWSSLAFIGLHWPSLAFVGQAWVWLLWGNVWNIWQNTAKYDDFVNLDPSSKSKVN